MEGVADAMTTMGPKLVHLVVKDRKQRKIDLLPDAASNCPRLARVEFRSFKDDCDTLEAILSKTSNCLRSLELRKVRSDKFHELKIDGVFKAGMYRGIVMKSQNLEKVGIRCDPPRDPEVFDAFGVDVVKAFAGCAKLALLKVTHSNEVYPWRNIVQQACNHRMRGLTDVHVWMCGVRYLPTWGEDRQGDIAIRGEPNGDSVSVEGSPEGAGVAVQGEAVVDEADMEVEAEI